MKKLYATLCSFLLIFFSTNSFSQAVNAPLPPTLSAATSNTITVSITSDGNPGNTEYSIYCATTGQYVQANGSLGVSEVKQIAATWGSTVVTGLSVSTNYCFYTTAYDGNNPITGTGTQILSTETFSTSSNFSTSGSAPTNMFWSPASCTNGGLTYTASGGCTDGYVGKTGNWTNFFGCFLRTPAINCTGQDSVVLNLDITHSYFANQITGDKTRFYMWVDGGYQRATSIKIGGQEVGFSDLNGLWLRFTEARTCANVSVTFDLTGVNNAASILFYIEPNNGYNNSNTFDVKLDNISLAGGVPTTACLSTTAGCTDTYSSFSAGGCGSYTVPSGNATYYSNGIYMDTIPNSGGCDSIMTIDVSIISASPVSIQQVGSALAASGSANYMWVDCTNWSLQTTSPIFFPSVTGEYAVIGIDGNGCLDTSDCVTISCIITDSTFSATGCGSYTVPSGNATYTVSNIYMDTIPNNAGCDSILTINVTINTPPTADVVVGGATFYASGGVAYEWLDCDSNYISTGDTGQYYTPSDPYRRYAAILYDANGCADTSDCVQLFTVGLNDLHSSKINIYPNPTDDYTTISFDNQFEGGSIVLYDLSGRMVKNIPIQNKATQVELDMSNLSRGLYTIQLISKNGEVRHLKVAKE